MPARGRKAVGIEGLRPPFDMYDRVGRFPGELGDLKQRQGVLGDEGEVDVGAFKVVGEHPGLVAGESSFVIEVRWRERHQSSILPRRRHFLQSRVRRPSFRGPYFGMEPASPDQAVANLLNGLNKGQYLILIEAIRQLGGSLTLDWAAVEAGAARPLPEMHVDASTGPVIMRLAE
jgi:hypothetical protein